MSRRRAVTIIEVLVAATIMMIVTVGILGLSIASGRTWSHGSARVITEDSASLALQRISQEIRGGSSATVDATGKILTVTYPNVNAAGDYERDNMAPVKTRYFVDNGVLYSQYGTTTRKALARRVTGIAFLLNGGQVFITLSSQQKVGITQRTALFQSEVTLRNPPTL